MKHGILFPDSIKTEKIKKIKYSNNRVLLVKGYLLPLFLFLAVAVFFVRLIYLQINQGQYYRSLADSNRIRTDTIYAPRGIIFDRNGEPLVLNIPGFRQITKTKDNNREVMTRPLDEDQALSMLAKGEKNIMIDSLRNYIYKDATAHILGYIGPISPSELKQQEFSGFNHNDFVGKTGIEKRYEQILRGKDGKKLVEVDAAGNEMRSLGQTDPKPGKDIYLTLDSKLQLASYKAAAGIKKGAIVVSKPDGEILAMVSIPSFDPNIFTLGEAATASAKKTLQSVLSDSINQPLLNRPISGLYPPGSTFKIVTAAAGLDGKYINQDFSITDTGILKIGEFSFANWYYVSYGKTESGKVDVVRALARSNDIFFYKLAEIIGVEDLSKMANKLGAGKRLGIDLPSEEKGLLPSKKWKEEKIGENWYLGDTYHFGIGQGYLLTTPLQVNSWTAAIANEGELYRPHLIKNQKNGEYLLEKKFLSDATISAIRKGMIESCEPGGVAWPLFNFSVRNPLLKIDNKNFMLASASISADKNDRDKYRKITIACKTGTSQHGSEKDLPHAWITLFAPAYKPEIVVTVLNEASGEGSNMAAPIAKKILETYFAK